MFCKFIVCVVVLALIAVASGVNRCKLPSHLWCSTRKTASDCQVTRQCEKHDWKHQKPAPPVSVVLYYEALCPYCKLFINEQLYPTFNKLMDTNVLNVTVLPFGNAHMTQQGNKWVFTCQHGEDECKGNLMATCAINSKSYNVTEYLPFLNCMEQNGRSGVNWDDVLKQCGPQFNMSVSNIQSCMKGSQGNKLEHQMGVATKQAGVYYVPWIVVNGQHSKEINEEAQHDLLKLVCQTYTGPPPSECSTVLEKTLRNVTFKNPHKAKFTRKH